MAALLHAEEDVDRLELGPQILDLVVVVAFELLQPHFELGLRGLDVLANESRPLLQVGANIAHGWDPPTWLTLAKPPEPGPGSRSDRLNPPDHGYLKRQAWSTVGGFSSWTTKQRNGIIADIPRAITDAPLRVGLGVPLLGEPNVAWPEDDVRAVHRLDEPGAFQSDDPQYGRLFVPGALPVRRLHNG